ncbi:hypothetical protein KY346_00280 [Candidatus Woesearchaeota archaeon]|nr:hypothetical protein [Candidatus Woesearchaeota archaeon]
MKRYLLIIALFVLVVLIWSPEFTYDPDLAVWPDFVLKAVGADKEQYITNLTSELSVTKDPWAKGDTYLVLARLENNTKYYKSACDNFLRYSPKTTEEKALLYETLASLDCRGRKIHYLRQAAQYWKKLGVKWRADILEALASKKKLEFQFETSVLESALDLSDANGIIIGSTTIEIGTGDTIVTQTDRVLRDWLGLQLRQSPFRGEILKVFSERLGYSERELLAPVGWHEGGRLRDIMKYVDITHVPAVGILVAKKGNKWYASDENGVFRFEIPKDKISYPTNRFLAEDLAVVVDSHGMNLLVEPAIRHGADVVIACCDHPDKIKAIKYLSGKGIAAICFTDLELYRALGHDTKAVGSAPFEFRDGKVVFGNTPVTIYRNQKVVAGDADIGKVFAIWYYKTPRLYFEELNKTFNIDLHFAAVDDFRQTGKVYEKARKLDANIVGARIYEAEDYIEAKEWLKESRNHKLVLFHSVAYPYGLLISQEFRNQVSFGDPNVVVID